MKTLQKIIYIVPIFLIFSLLARASGPNFNDTTQQALAPNAAGNVGIGSAAPGQTLDVQGTVRVLNFTMSSQGPANGYVLSASDSSGDTKWISLGGISGWTISGNNVYETAGGNVGIGTNLLTTSALTVMNGNVGIGTWIPGGSLIVQGGNVGIGTNSPSASFTVNGNSILGETNYSNDTISSTGSGSLAGGFVLHAIGNSGMIESTNQGSLAFGVGYGSILGGNGDLLSEGQGSIAMGDAYNNATLEAINDGSIAMGYSNGSLSVATLESTGLGSFAMGLVNGGTLESTGSGSIAMGYANGGTLNAGGQASVAIGQNVQATASNSFALGTSVINNTASSFMVGFNTTPTLTVTGTNVGIGTFNPFGGGLIVTNGNVGIDSLAPGQALDVQGTVRTVNFTMSGQAPISGYVLTAKDSAGDATWSSAGGVSGWTVTGNNVYETDNGNVGIGTNLLTTAALTVMNGNVGIGTWVPGTPFQVNGSIQNVNISSAGNIGIGSLNPAYSLAVNNFGTGLFDFNNSQIDFHLSQTALVFGAPSGSTVGGQTPLTFGNNNLYTTSAASPFFLINPNSSNIGNLIEIRLGSTPEFLVSSAGNVGIGSATPGQALDVQGTVRAIGLTMSGQSPISGYVLTASDSAGDATWSSAGGVSGWTVTGNDVYETRMGNVGIGTWAPGASLIVQGGNVGIGTNVAPLALTVNGGMQIEGAAFGYGTVFVINSVGEIYTPYTSGVSAGSDWYDFGNGNNASQGSPSNIFFHISASSANSGSLFGITKGGINEEIIDTNGNLGIGSTAPSQTLDVQGTVRAIRFTMSGQAPISGYVLTASDSAGDATWSSAGGVSGWTVTGNDVYETRMGNVGIGTVFVNQAALTVNGNVGIGTWVPGGLLAVGITSGFTVTNAGTINDNSGSVLNMTASNPSIQTSSVTAGGVTLIEGGNSTTSDLKLQSASHSSGTTDAIIFAVNNGVEGMRLQDNSGIANLGIGSTNPGQILDVTGTARMTGFELTTGATAGSIMVSNTVGVGTWMATGTLPLITVTVKSPNDVTYYSSTNALTGSTGFQTNGTNVGIGTSGLTNATLQVVGNIGIGTVANGDSFITTAPPNGGMILEGNVGLGTAITASFLQIGPGTATKPPIILGTGAIGTAGTTGIAGAIEFDGTAFYDTAAPLSRQVIDSEQFVALINNFTLVNGSSAQPVFGGVGAPPNGQITVTPHTTYLFDALYLISNGTTTHETAVGFGGTATISNVDYTSYIWSTAANAPTTAQTFEWIQSAALTNCNSTNSNSNSTTIVLKGIIRIGATNSTNTVVPEIVFRAIPGGTNTMNNDSYFRLYPLGSDQVVYQGEWS